LWPTGVRLRPSKKGRPGEKGRGRGEKTKVPVNRNENPQSGKTVTLGLGKLRKRGMVNYRIYEDEGGKKDGGRLSGLKSKKENKKKMLAIALNFLAAKKSHLRWSADD